MSAPTPCRPAPAGGRLALLGRAKLRAEMTTPGESAGCDCPRCCPPPLTDLEAQAALRHVSNADAVALALGRVTLVGFYLCESCGGWIPSFTETT
ncbi:hypothetical protein [Mycolicibacterium tokaiense]|uniref:Uncharacterized protein n=1 Tax=Mycolicibacterium tokaiense TaxID=39695 RepID=A0A378TJG1_9MYCO|nr:hypothetical protein [Mycolicibacterium tokaiense]BBY84704.1 hypothetical protein MTOK_04860 [Mycolicibacterium tokaiense]STZ60790.1 Uncharacterised protein [Mycolicibacterium tokaiense]